MAKFADLLVILKFAFENGVSEAQYHAIVELIREYEKFRDSRTTEEASLVAVGWPTSYDPCEYKERIRVAFHFVRHGSETLDDHIRAFQSNQNKTVPCVDGTVCEFGV